MNHLTRKTIHFSHRFKQRREKSTFPNYQGQTFEDQVVEEMTRVTA